MSITEKFDGVELPDEYHSNSKMAVKRAVSSIKGLSVDLVGSVLDDMNVHNVAAQELVRKIKQEVKVRARVTFTARRNLGFENDSNSGTAASMQVLFPLTLEKYVTRILHDRGFTEDDTEQNVRTSRVDGCFRLEYFGRFYDDITLQQVIGTRPLDGTGCNTVRLHNWTYIRAWSPDTVSISPLFRNDGTLRDEEEITEMCKAVGHPRMERELRRQRELYFKVLNERD